MRSSQDRFGCELAVCEPQLDEAGCVRLTSVSLSSFGRLRMAADDVGENPDGIGKPVRKRRNRAESARITEGSRTF